MRGSQLVLVVMVAFAIASSATLLSDEIFRYVHRTPNIVGIPDTAVMVLRGIVPKGETLGFISDGSDPGAVGRRLYGATYSLVPLVIDSTANRRFVIGDFRTKASIPTALSQHRLYVVKDLGNGFLLLAAQ
jgi:hypothetical protein